jgi:hypothetical protein
MAKPLLPLVCAIELALAVSCGLFPTTLRAGEPCQVHDRVQTHCRAGCPLWISRLAAPSNTRNNFGYYVGGGAAWRHGEPRYLNEGTWGWDYNGILFPKRVALGWSHGARYQGGTGAYRTAGPSHFLSQ